MLLPVVRTRRFPVAGSALVVKGNLHPVDRIGRQHQPPLVHRYLEAVSRFFEMGMSVPEVALISGHKDVRQLFRYTHLNPTNVFQKYEAF